MLVFFFLIMVAAAEDRLTGKRARVVCGVAAISIAITAAWLADGKWRASGEVLRDLKTVLAELPSGEGLSPYPSAVASQSAFIPPSAYHAATYAVIERHAMVPSVFAFRGQQPIRLGIPAEIAAEWQSWILRGAQSMPDPDLLRQTSEYVLVIRGEGGPSGEIFPIPAEVIAQAGRFTLHRLAQ